MSFGLSGRSLSRSRHDYLDAWAWVGSFDLSHSVWTTSLSTSTVVREALGDQIEMPVITGSSAFADDDREGRFADDDRRMPPPSYPAKAGYPVRCGVGDQIEMPVITGSSAFADDDREGPLADDDRRMGPGARCFHHTPPSPSYPAKAGYPVRRGVGDQIEMPAITGSSAFADDDREGPLADDDRRMGPGARCFHHTPPSPSYPAKAGYPVRRGVGD